MQEDLDLVGRARELALLRRTIESARKDSRFVLIEGEAGIGKTSLLRALGWHASRSGFRVLTAIAGEVERDLPYVALGDLLEPVADELAGLPGPQRDALDAILVRRRLDRPVDPRTVGVTLLNAIRLAAERQPLLLVIDDVQWVDASSLVALRYAARRLRAEPVAVAACLRTESALLGRQGADAARESGADGFGVRQWTEVIRLLPMGPSSLQAILRRRGFGRLSPSRLAELQRLSEGNPLLAIELAQGGDEGDSPYRLLEPPQRVARLIGGRLEKMPTEVRRLLAVAATLRRPDRAHLASLVGPEMAARTIEQAIAGGLLALNGDRLEFSHPLVRSTILTELPPGVLSAVHLQAAALVADLDERAYHLALGTTTAADAVSRLIEESARRVAGRGAPAEASMLAERAARLTPSSTAHRVERLLLAGENAFLAGDSERASTLLREAAAMPAPRDRRAHVLLALALTEAEADSVEKSLETMEEALKLAVEDQVKATILTRMADVGRFFVGMEKARRWAEEAVRLAAGSDQPSLQSQALAIAGLLDFNITGRISLARMNQAIAFEGTDGPIDSSPRLSLAHQLMWSGRLAEAQPHLESLLGRWEPDSDVTGSSPLWYLALLEWFAGHWDRATELADRELRLVEHGGWDASLASALWLRALVGISRGELVRGRERAEQALALSRATGHRPFVAMNMWVLGLADLLEGAPTRPPDEEVEAFDAPTNTAPGAMLALPDVIEALVRSGALDEAESLLSMLEERAAAPEHPFGWPATQRARATLLAARGDLSGALRALEPWAETPSEPAFPLFAGRILMLRGQLLRRARRRSASRKSLHAALALFRGLGASPWAHLAEQELERLGTKQASPLQLSDAESRVASLAAGGRTNREIAAELFLSRKTVEWTLTRVYGKLGVRSRVELAMRFVGRPPPA